MRWFVVIGFLVGWAWWWSGCGGEVVNSEWTGDATTLPEWFLMPDEPFGAEPIPQDWLPEPTPQGKFTLTSSAFTNGKKIPARYGCEADGNFQKPSIPLSWQNPPEGTKSFVIVMDDLAPSAQEWIHWVVYNLPANVSSLAEGASQKNMPAGAKELNNTWQLPGYGGPCPPSDIDIYRIRIFAMPTEQIELQSADKSSGIMSQLKDVLGVAELRGEYP